MQRHGSSRKTVLAELRKLQLLDQQYKDGRILCSMCTKPHPVAAQAYRMFFDSNLGDSGLFPGAAQLEKEVILQLASLLGNEEAAGFLVSGGTEANLMALLAARNRLKIDKPEVVLPNSAHFSFTKICGMLKIKPVYADLDTSFRVSTQEVKKHVNKNTVAIVGTAGTAELGAVDPIEGLSQIAAEKNIWLHVDAAFGGLVLPFLKKPLCLFDFSLPAVNSITVDPHKMGMAAIPAGGVLFRDRELLDLVKTETPYLTDKIQHTFLGTRSGAAAASAWAVFKYLGTEGFKKVVNACMKNTQRTAGELEKSGFKLLVKPTLNIIAFRDQNTKRLAEHLWQRGWFVSYVPRYDCIRIVIMPHTKSRHLGAFLNDLNETEKL